VGPAADMLSRRRRRRRESASHGVSRHLRVHTVPRKCPPMGRCDAQRAQRHDGFEPGLKRVRPLAKRPSRSGDEYKPAMTLCKKSLASAIVPRGGIGRIA